MPCSPRSRCLVLLPDDDAALRRRVVDRGHTPIEARGDTPLRVAAAVGCFDVVRRRRPRWICLRCQAAAAAARTRAADRRRRPRASGGLRPGGQSLAGRRRTATGRRARLPRGRRVRTDPGVGCERARDGIAERARTAVGLGVNGRHRSGGPRTDRQPSAPRARSHRCRDAGRRTRLDLARRRGVAARTSAGGTAGSRRKL